MHNIWLVGTGSIGIEYAKILDKLNVNFTAIGRSEHKTKAFEEATGHKAIGGGLAKFAEGAKEAPSAAIVAVGVEDILETARLLLHAGTRLMLIEKPGGLNAAEITELTSLSESHKATTLIAYNRRFYSSVIKAQEIIAADGGVTSFHFEFTEWSHVIAKLDKSPELLAHWFLANSTHVADTAFFLGGKPVELSAYRSGGNAWHPGGTIYAGAGRSAGGALFSYQANWESPGRWSIEVNTRQHRLYFRPMEALAIQKIGSVAVEPYEIDNHLDQEFKPGFYLQTKAFIEGDHGRFCSIREQQVNIEAFYTRMCGY